MDRIQKPKDSPHNSYINVLLSQHLRSSLKCLQLKKSDNFETYMAFVDKVIQVNIGLILDIFCCLGLGFEILLQKLNLLPSSGV
jgi:hypothetical protein